MVAELKRMQELGWITEADSERFHEMIRVLYNATEAKEIRDAFAAKLEEFKRDPNTSLLSLAIASIAFDSADSVSDQPVEAARSVIGADVGGAALGGLAGFGGGGTGPSGDPTISLVDEETALVGAIIGAGFCSGNAAVENAKG